MNANNNATATATSANRPGRPTGFRLKFTIKAGKVKEGIEKEFLSGQEKMTIVNERKRSQEEILAIITANPSKVTDPVFMASVVTEKLDCGMTLAEVVDGMADSQEVEVARVDIANFYDLAKETALSFLSRNATKDES